MTYFATNVLPPPPGQEQNWPFIAFLHLEIGQPLCGTKISVKQMTQEEIPELPVLGSL